MTSAARARVALFGLGCALVLQFGAPAGTAQAQDALNEEVRVRFLGLLVEHSDAPSNSLAWLDANWRDDEFVPMALESVRFVRQRETSRALLDLVARKTGATGPGYSWSAWMRWQWTRPAPPPAFAAFKSALYGNIDPRFEKYFSPAYPALIRLDEVVWGGVLQDGIPPLREPKMLTAGNARYLADSDVVFGVEINGDARAYPKRILAWHEMFVDHDRRRRRRRRLLHTVRRGHRLRNRRRRAGARVGHQRLSLSLEQAHVRREDAVAVEHAGGSSGHRTTGRQGHFAAHARSGDDDLGRLATPASEDHRAVAGHRSPARLRRGRGLRELLRHRRAHVSRSRRGSAPAQQAGSAGAALRPARREAAGDRLGFPARTTRSGRAATAGGTLSC